MQRGDRHVMVVVKVIDEAIGQVAPRMIINVDQSGNTGRIRRRSLSLTQAGTGEIAQRLGTVLVSAPGDQSVQFRQKIVLDGNGHSLHGTALLLHG